MDLLNILLNVNKKTAGIVLPVIDFITIDG